MKTWQVSIRVNSGLYRMLNNYATREEALEAWEQHYYHSSYSERDSMELDNIYEKGMYYKSPRPTDAEREPSLD